MSFGKKTNDGVVKVQSVWNVQDCIRQKNFRNPETQDVPITADRTPSATGGADISRNQTSLAEQRD